MARMPIYMDHHATTPVDERVLDAMRPYFSEQFGNASSRVHRYGKVARDAVERARTEVAELIGARSEEIIFTSGATESDNLAIRGTALARESHGKHIITVRTEHKAVLDTCGALQREGWQVTWLDVDQDGLVSPETLAAAITDQTVLASVMLSNNEVGVVQDVAALGAIARERGVVFHCDAAQGLGYLPFSVDAMNVDMVSLSGHKMYGPKGIGGLYIRKSAQQRGLPTPLMHGGGHEGGFRSGTLNVPGIVGFGAAARIMTEEGREEAERLASLRDGLADQLLGELPEVRLNGVRSPRHPGNLNLSFGYVDGAQLLIELCEVVAVSSGSACSSVESGPSYVLQAMGVPKDWSAASIRFGLGRHNTAGEVDEVADAVCRTVDGLRERSALWAAKQSGKAIEW